jgi:repressor LexA
MSDSNDSRSPAPAAKKPASRRTSHLDVPPDPRPPLTPRQRDVLEIIRASVKEKGYPPTVREICAKIGANSPHAAAFHLNELVRKGYLQHAGGKRSRALAIVELTPDLEKTIPFRGKVS